MAHASDERIDAVLAVLKARGWHRHGLVPEMENLGKRLGNNCVRLVMNGALALTVGCGVSNPTDGNSLHFEILRSEPGIQKNSYAELQSKPQELRVMGGLTMPDPCHELSGSVQHEQRDVMLTVRIGPHEGGCADVVVWTEYRAVIHKLLAGEYRVSVRHLSETAGTADTIINKVQVVVP